MNAQSTTGSAADVLQALTSGSLKPVLIDCYTPGCGPCASLAPVLDALSQDYEEQLVIEKIDVAANPEVAAKYGVRGVPTLLLFKNGELLASRKGAATRTQLITWLSANGAV